MFKHKELNASAELLVPYFGSRRLAENTALKLWQQAVSARGNGNIVYLIQSSREGLSFNQFRQLSEDMPFSMREWSEILHISEHTIQRYKKEGLAFEPLQSERILEIALLKRKGIDVFGSEKNFYTWLKSVNPALGGILPRELLDNSFGIGLIKDELLRIEHGVLA